MENEIFYLIKNGVGRGYDLNLRCISIGYRNSLAADNTDRRDEDELCFVVKGHGSLQTAGKNVYMLKSGMAFFIPKDSKISLWPKADDPFEYYRITVDALDNRNFFEQIGFNKAHPVIYFSDGVLERVEELYETVKSATVASTYKGISLLYEICSLLAEQTTVQEKEKDENEYIAKAVAYINAKYYDDINVNKMADTLNINRSYFSTLFKKHMGVSPLAYLTEFRISQACKLLAMDKNITEVAILTGFNTPANFSVSFKRIMKMAPLDYKKYLKSKGEK